MPKDDLFKGGGGRVDTVGWNQGQIFPRGPCKATDWDPPVEISRRNRSELDSGPIDVGLNQDTARAKNDERIAAMFDVGDDVRRQNDRHPTIANMVDEGDQEIATGQRIQASQRLVEQEQWRLLAEGKGQGYLRLLAT